MRVGGERPKNQTAPGAAPSSSRQKARRKGEMATAVDRLKNPGKSLLTPPPPSDNQQMIIKFHINVILKDANI